MSYDLIFQGGRVVDPANGVDGIADVAIADGKIAKVGTSLPADGVQAVVDVSGLLVTPGLIDIHVHAYTGRLNDGPGLFVARCGPSVSKEKSFEPTSQTRTRQGQWLKLFVARSAHPTCW